MTMRSPQLVTTSAPLTVLGPAGMLRNVLFQEDFVNKRYIALYMYELSGLTRIF